MKLSCSIGSEKSRLVAASFKPEKVKQFCLVNIYLTNDARIDLKLVFFKFRNTICKKPAWHHDGKYKNGNSLYWTLERCFRKRV